MKNLILLTLIGFTLLSCNQASIDSNNLAFETCFKSKLFPTLPKGNIFIEGELDGHFFSISPSSIKTVETNLSSFYQQGYKKSYANTNEWFGTAFTVLNGNTSDLNYRINIGFQTFQGDSTAYNQYFNQFKKGNSFQFFKLNKETKAADYNKAGIIYFEIELLGCDNQTSVPNGSTGLSTNSNIISSQLVDNTTESFCKISEVKETKLANGTIQHDLTFEFDVKLGANDISTKRIKNGKLVFSY